MGTNRKWEGREDETAAKVFVCDINQVADILSARPS